MSDKFEDLLGQTLVKIERDGNDSLTFHTADAAYRMWHSQDCCENVVIEELIGDLNDLIGSPILLAEEVVNDHDVTPEGCTPPQYPESYLWTFYKLATHKGHVTIRWLGESNGYYSESVDFDKVPA